jgi:hypothetical protein
MLWQQQQQEVSIVVDQAARATVGAAAEAEVEEEPIPKEGKAKTISKLIKLTTLQSRIFYKDKNKLQIKMMEMNLILNKIILILI